MKFQPGELFEIDECDALIIIRPYKASMPALPGIEPLMAGDAPTCVEYLGRYVEARQGGASLKDAHARALKGALITAPGSQDAPR